MEIHSSKISNFYIQIVSISYTFNWNSERSNISNFYIQIVSK